MFNFIKADAGACSVPSYKPGSYKCSWECLYYSKHIFTLLAKINVTKAAPSVASGATGAVSHTYISIILKIPSWVTRKGSNNIM